MRWRIIVRPILLAIVLVGGAASAVFAQTEGRIGVGGAFNINATTDSEVGIGKGVGVVVRLTPRRGWSPTGSINWFKADLSNPSGPSGDFATLHVRPLMGGVSYTIGPDRLLTSFSVVGGPSFNSAEFHDGFIRSNAAEIHVDNSVAMRTGIAESYVIRPRVALIGFGGYTFNRPGIVFRDSINHEFRDRWRADSIVLAVGAIYSLF